MGLRESQEWNLRENRSPFGEAHLQRQTNGPVVRDQEGGQESFILMADIMACLCADGNRLVESEKLITRERTGERM